MFRKNHMPLYKNPSWLLCPKPMRKLYKALAWLIYVPWFDMIILFYIIWYVLDFMWRLYRLISCRVITRLPMYSYLKFLSSLSHHLLIEMKNIVTNVINWNAWYDVTYVCCVVHLWCSTRGVKSLDTCLGAVMLLTFFHVSFDDPSA